MTLHDLTPKNAHVKGDGSPRPTAQPIPSPSGIEAEEQWIQAARKGDRDAFTRLLEKHQDAVMTACRYLVSHQEDALDLTQETFLRAWRSLGGFAGQSSFRTWLLVIATNAARSLAAHRRAKKRSSPVIPLETKSGEFVDIPEPEEKGSPEYRAIRGEMKEAIEDAIAALDGESRSLIILRDLMGESYETISSNLGLPLGTVKSRIHRARLELRESLKNYL